MPPEDGLSALSAVISSSAASPSFPLHLPVPAAVAAGKLLWDALLKSGAPRCGNGMYSEFASPQTPQHAQSAKSGKTENAATGRLPSSTVGGDSRLETRAGSRPGVAALDGAAWEASVLSNIIAIVVGVVGGEISADQPLMEVSDGSI